MLETSASETEVHAMPHFANATCPKCHNRFGWTSDEKPPCPHCGWKEDSAEAARVEALLEKRRQEIMAEWDKEDENAR